MINKSAVLNTVFIHKSLKNKGPYYVILNGIK